MAEYTTAVAQTVAENGNVLFTETPVSSGRCITHRDGSGVVMLRGITNQCKARYKVFFGGNIAVPTGGTAEAITIAISVQGEALASTDMIATPAAVETYSNVSGAAFIEVEQGCCATVAVKNISTQPVLVANANIIVERVA